jgi:adenine-specific DNA-methyltransferase
VEWFTEAVARGDVDLEELERRGRDAAVTLQQAETEQVTLTWPGKRAAQETPASTDEIRIDPPDDTTSCDQLIIGDNLPVMRALAGSLSDAVDLAYIDPPYNTGRGFTFDDRFPAPPGVRSDARRGRRGQRERSAWLNFMYPRLIALRDLMSARGLLVAHIDEHEHETLVMICKEIFGDASYLGSLVWDKGNPKGDAKRVAYQHEHIVVFAKDPKHCPPLRRPKENAQRILDAAADSIRGTSSLAQAREEFSRWMKAARGLSGGEAMYARISEDRRVYRLVSMAWPNKKTAPPEYFQPLLHPVTGAPCPVPARGWRNPPGTMEELLARGLIEFGTDHSTQPQRRYFLDEHMHENVPSVIRFAGADDDRLRELGIPFEHPKPVELATRLLSWFGPPDAVVFDCFAGSGTTGHAVWEANLRDGGTRRFVLVQAPEPVFTSASAEVDGRTFESVDEITRTRLERVAAGYGDDERGPSPRLLVRRLVQQ